MDCSIEGVWLLPPGFADKNGGPNSFFGNVGKWLISGEKAFTSATATRVAAVGKTDTQRRKMP